MKRMERMKTAIYVRIDENNTDLVAAAAEVGRDCGGESGRLVDVCGAEMSNSNAPIRIMPEPAMV